MRVAGIPAIARVTNFYPGHGGNYTGHPDFRYPKEYPEIEFEICDKKGRPAPWLERKIDDQEKEDLASQLIKHILTTKEEFDYDTP